MSAPRTKSLKEREDQRNKMWDMWKSGMSKYRIAKIFGCHETNVGNILARMVRKNEEKNKAS